MDALTALHTRNSVNLLSEPAPSKTQIDNLLKAAVRACDHHSLTPWKFLLIQGKARNRLGEIFVEAASQDKVISQEECRKIESKPLRAPTIIAVAADIKPHEKVPVIEQMLSAGAAAQMIMVAAHAQGLGAIWRSGKSMFSPHVHHALGLSEQQKLVAFIYIGQSKKTKKLTKTNIENLLCIWDGNTIRTF